MIATLPESEQLLRQMADNAPVLMWRARPDKQCDYFNAAWLEFTGRTAEQEAGMGWLESVHPDDRARCLETFETAFDARRPFTMEYRLRRHDGNFRWVLDNGAPYEAAGRFAGYFGSGIDITDRRNAEEQARRAVREKEQALQELHHRVRNNMQLVSSLLNMQASMVADPTVRQHLVEAQQRVRLLARIQQQLYQTERVRSLPVGRILKELCGDLARPLQHDGGRTRLDIETDDRELPADQVILLALITNELVSNALKYAYPGNADGTVTVRFAGEPDGGYRLTVADRGVGLPPDFEPTRSRSLGMVLVMALSQQLNARLELDRSAPGVAFTLHRPGDTDEG